MEYQNFIHTLMQSLCDALGSDISVQLGERDLNNGLKQDTFIIRDCHFNIAPSIYINPYYSRYQSGMNLEDICSDILNAYYNAAPSTDFDVDAFFDFETAKEHICMRLINYELNKERLNTSPHIRYLDLAITFVYLTDQFDDQYASITIQHSHLEHWQITTDELYRIARRQMPQILPPHFDTIEHVLKNSPYELPQTYTFEDCPMLVLSNSKSSFGATSILYPGLLKQLAERYRSDLLLIPSSIHEVLILPLDEYPPSVYIDGMIRDINALELQDTDVLSDHAYYYYRDSDSVKLS